VSTRSLGSQRWRYPASRSICAAGSARDPLLGTAILSRERASVTTAESTVCARTVPNHSRRLGSWAPHRRIGRLTRVVVVLSLVEERVDTNTRTVVVLRPCNPLRTTTARVFDEVGSSGGLRTTTTRVQTTQNSAVQAETLELVDLGEVLRQLYVHPAGDEPHRLWLSHVPRDERVKIGVRDDLVPGLLRGDEAARTT